ncbi:MAG TPA: cyclic nucleotide-binding domain-containing protein [Actinomycetota bacterium]|nr:cyclic nucleotide-binding domain-containing protein [Actinomycetota bacterium]
MKYIVIAALMAAAAVLAIDWARQKRRHRSRPRIDRSVESALGRPATTAIDIVELIRGADEVESPEDSLGGIYDAVDDALDFRSWRPKVAAGVEVKVFEFAHADDYALISTPEHNEFFELEVWEGELIPLMDGSRTVDELIVERLTADGALDAASVAGLVEMLRIKGMLEPRSVQLPPLIRARLVPASGGRLKLREFAKTMRIGWDGAEAFTQAMYRIGFRWLFRPSGVAVCAVLAIAGFAALISIAVSGRFELELRTAPQETVILLGLSFVLTAFHELGHALVLVHYDRRVISSGFMIFFAAPAFYVDASDGQMLDRRQRVIQSFGGPWAELVLAGAASLMLFAFPSAGFAPLLYRFAVVNYFVIFENLIPLLRLDGYWILTDLLNDPDLRGRSLSFIQHDLWRKLFRREHIGLRDTGLALYGIVGLAYTIFSFWVALFFWQLIFGEIVAELWRDGWFTRFLLLLLVLAFAGPLIRGALDAGRAGWRRLKASVNRVRFRLETSWRIEAAQLIDDLPVFDDLPEELLNDLAGRVRLRTVPPGRAVFEQGDRPDAMYVVRSGELAVEDVDAETGDARTLRTLERGDGFGELGLVDMAPRAATVRATTNAELFEVDKPTFDRLLADAIDAPTFAPTLAAYARIRALPPFVHLPIDQIAAVLERGEWRAYPPAELVITQGEPGDRFYVIESGQTDVIRDDEVITTLGAGAFFGELALLNDAPRNASVVTRTPTQVFTLDKDGFDRIVADDLGTARPDEQRRRDMEH